jgi:hypothetical protein
MKTISTQVFDEFTAHNFKWVRQKIDGEKIFGSGFDVDPWGTEFTLTAA